MCAAATSEMVPATAEAGQQSALQIVDGDNSPDGRTVCIIPGNLKRRLDDGNFMQLLDEQDVPNAAMILLLPQLRNTMFRLAEWASRTGVWDAPCWRSAEALMKELREIGGDA